MFGLPGKNFGNEIIHDEAVVFRELSHTLAYRILLVVACEIGHALVSFAKLAQRELAEMDSVPSRGVKQAPFVVLMGVRMPASLMEIGFLSNSKEEKGLRTPARREAIAQALARAVAAFGEDHDKRYGAHPDVPAARPDAKGGAE